MKRVLKWNVPVDDRRHEVGAGRVVHVAAQYGDVDILQLWTEEETEEVALIEAQVFGTGHEYPDNGVAVGTVLVHGGELVWHVVVFPGEDWKLIR